MTEKSRRNLLLAGALNLVEGLSLFTIGQYVYMNFQALAFAYLDKVSEMTEDLLSAEVAKILADGRVWMLVGGLFVILGLSLFVTGLRAKVTPSREK